MHYPRQARSKYLNVVRSLLRLPAGTPSTADLRVLYEDRPYELGWLLYAFGRFGLPEVEPGS